MYPGVLEYANDNTSSLQRNRTPGLTPYRKMTENHQVSSKCFDSYVMSKVQRLVSSKLCSLHTIPPSHISYHTTYASQPNTSQRTSPSQAISSNCKSQSTRRHTCISPIITLYLSFILNQPPASILPLDLFSSPHTHWYSKTH